MLSLNPRRVGGGLRQAALLAGAAVSECSAEGFSALIYASLMGHEACVVALLHAGAPVNPPPPCQVRLACPCVVPTQPAGRVPDARLPPRLTGQADVAWSTHAQPGNPTRKLPRAAVAGERAALKVQGARAQVRLPWVSSA